uniref:Uncharacterized protein MANES_14G166400 n=1 Tax=Rhizophora mucronata TaxID=61149 RepID=A0A2P2J8A2_RHIMU
MEKMMQLKITVFPRTKTETMPPPSRRLGVPSLPTHQCSTIPAPFLLLLQHPPSPPPWTSFPKFQGHRSFSTTVWKSKLRRQTLTIIISGKGGTAAGEIATRTRKTCLLVSISRTTLPAYALLYFVFSSLFCSRSFLVSRKTRIMNDEIDFETKLDLQFSTSNLNLVL